MMLILALLATTLAPGLGLQCYKGDKTMETCNSTSLHCQMEHYKITLEQLVSVTTFTIRGCAEGCTPDASYVEVDRKPGESTTTRMRSCCQGDKCNKKDIEAKLCYSCLSTIPGTTGCNEDEPKISDPNVILTTCTGSCEKWVWEKSPKIVGRSCKPICVESDFPLDGSKSRSFCCNGEKCNHGARITWSTVTVMAVIMALFMA